jgi:NADH dehydrogenase/NADH:ubiquinone oxidoreductase subunit G
MYNQNEKLNQIFRDTWPNLGWAKRMNEDMPWVNLTQEEVEELRNKKHELTEYGKDKIRELMRNQEPYPDAMFEEAERREAERKALDAVEKLYKENGDALKRLAEIEKEEWERKERSDTVLARYNHFYNEECSGMPHGTPITPEHMQAMALECMVDALICENMNVEYNVIAIDDIKDLIAGLYKQSDEFLERVRKNNE